MTDVRALLREQRASRRLDHPYASYATSGQLSCSMCHIAVKSETLWDSHLRSSGHINALKQAQKAAADVARRKRKATEDETHSRKKSRSDIPAAPHAAEEEDNDQEGDSADAGAATEAETVLPGFVRSEEAAPAPNAPPAPTPAPAVDEDEWAAFERDIATPPPSTVISTAATISAAPLTAEELRAQEAEASRKDRRDAEVEAEKEDATRALEEEFDEMEALEARVRRLREQREALRKGRDGQGALGASDEVLTGAVANGVATGSEPGLKHDEENAYDDDDDDDDEDDDDEWNLWKT